MRHSTIKASGRSKPRRRGKKPPAPSPKRTNASKLAGRKFGRLRVLEETQQRASNGAIVWECECMKCGTRRMVSTSNLTTGNTLGCGCVQRERSGAANAAGGVRWQGAKTS
jgi:hypothetical protein